MAAAGAVAWAPEAVLSRAAGGYPWLAFALAFGLSALFHRSRPACLALLLAGLAWSLGAGAQGPLARAVLAATVALAAGGLALTRDRGIAATIGLGQLAFTAFVGGMGLTAALAPPSAVATLMEGHSFPRALTAWTGLPEFAALLLAAALLASAYAALRYRGPVERGLPWMLLAAVLALRPGGEGPEPLLWLMAAGLVLAASVLETGYAMAYRDDLTGLPGRRALMRDLEALGGRYTVAMVDVDHFKKFNDRHGHDVGDQVLRMVAGHLAGVRGGGRSYRYGGEEFTVVFPGRSREEAIPHLEALRSAVEGARFAVRSRTRPAAKPKQPRPADPRRLSVTVSLGVAEAAEGATTSDAVLKKADKALYRAKKAGRNRVAT